MFKKFSKSGSEPEQETPSPYFPHLSDRPTNPFSTDLMNALHPRNAQENVEREEEPETVIAAGVTIKGTMTFQKLIRIDGTFEGELHSSGKLIIGPSGEVKADIDLEEAFISGKITGNIKVKKRVVLRGRAQVKGDITAPLLSVDEGVCILGILHIAQETTATSTEEEDPYLSDN